MVFHHLSKRRAGMSSAEGGPGAGISSTGPPWVWNEKISKKFLFSLQFIQQK